MSVDAKKDRTFSTGENASTLSNFSTLASLPDTLPSVEKIPKSSQKEESQSQITAKTLSIMDSNFDSRPSELSDMRDQNLKSQSEQSKEEISDDNCKRSGSVVRSDQATISIPSSTEVKAIKPEQAEDETADVTNELQIPIRVTENLSPGRNTTAESQSLMSNEATSHDTTMPTFEPSSYTGDDKKAGLTAINSSSNLEAASGSQSHRESLGSQDQTSAKFANLNEQIRQESSGSQGQLQDGEVPSELQGNVVQESAGFATQKSQESGIGISDQQTSKSTLSKIDSNLSYPEQLTSTDRSSKDRPSHQDPGPKDEEVQTSENVDQLTEKSGDKSTTEDSDSLTRSYDGDTDQRNLSNQLPDKSLQNISFSNYEDMREALNVEEQPKSAAQSTSGTTTTSKSPETSESSGTSGHDLDTTDTTTSRVSRITEQTEPVTTEPPYANQNILVRVTEALESSKSGSTIVGKQLLGYDLNENSTSVYIEDEDFVVDSNRPTVTTTEVSTNKAQSHKTSDYDKLERMSDKLSKESDIQLTENETDAQLAETQASHEHIYAEIIKPQREKVSEAADDKESKTDPAIVSRTTDLSPESTEQKINPTTHSSGPSFVQSADSGIKKDETLTDVDDNNKMLDQHLIESSIGGTLTAETMSDLSSPSETIEVATLNDGKVVAQPVTQSKAGDTLSENSRTERNQRQDAMPYYDFTASSSVSRKVVGSKDETSGHKTSAKRLTDNSMKIAENETAEKDAIKSEQFVNSEIEQPTASEALSRETISSSDYVREPLTAKLSNQTSVKQANLKRLSEDSRGQSKQSTPASSMRTASRIKTNTETLSTQESLTINDPLNESETGEIKQAEIRKLQESDQSQLTDETTLQCSQHFVGSNFDKDEKTITAIDEKTLENEPMEAPIEKELMEAPIDEEPMEAPLGKEPMERLENEPMGAPENKAIDSPEIEPMAAALDGEPIGTFEREPIKTSSIEPDKNDRIFSENSENVVRTKPEGQSSVEQSERPTSKESESQYYCFSFMSRAKTLNYSKSERDFESTESFYKNLQPQEQTADDKQFKYYEDGKIRSIISTEPSERSSVRSLSNVCSVQSLSRTHSKSQTKTGSVKNEEKRSKDQMSKSYGDLLDVVSGSKQQNNTSEITVESQSAVASAPSSGQNLEDGSQTLDVKGQKGSELDFLSEKRSEKIASSPETGQIMSSNRFQSSNVQPDMSSQKLLKESVHSGLSEMSTSKVESVMDTSFSRKFDQKSDTGSQQGKMSDAASHKPTQNVNSVISEVSASAVNSAVDVSSNRQSRDENDVGSQKNSLPDVSSQKLIKSVRTGFQEDSSSVVHTRADISSTSSLQLEGAGVQHKSSSDFTGQKLIEKAQSGLSEMSTGGVQSAFNVSSTSKSRDPIVNETQSVPLSEVSSQEHVKSQKTGRSEVSVCTTQSKADLRSISSLQGELGSTKNSDFTSHKTQSRLSKTSLSAVHSDISAISSSSKEHTLDDAHKATLSDVLSRKSTKSPKTGFSELSASAVQSNNETFSIKSLQDVTANDMQPGDSSAIDEQKNLQKEEAGCSSISASAVASALDVCSAYKSGESGLSDAHKFAQSDISGQKTTKSVKTGRSEASASAVQSNVEKSSTSILQDMGEKSASQTNFSEVSDRKPLENMEAGASNISASVVVSATDVNSANKSHDPSLNASLKKPVHSNNLRQTQTESAQTIFSGVSASAVRSNIETGYESSVQDVSKSNASQHDNSDVTCQKVAPTLEAVHSDLSAGAVQADKVHSTFKSGEFVLTDAHKPAQSEISSQKTTKSVKTGRSEASASAVQSNVEKSSTSILQDMGEKSASQTNFSEVSDRKPLENMEAGASNISASVVESATDVNSGIKSHDRNLYMPQKQPTYTDDLSQAHTEGAQTRFSEVSPSAVHSKNETGSESNVQDVCTSNASQNDPSVVTCQKTTTTLEAGHSDLSASAVQSASDVQSATKTNDWCLRASPKTAHSDVLSQKPTESVKNGSSKMSASAVRSNVETSLTSSFQGYSESHCSNGNSTDITGQKPTDNLKTGSSYSSASAVQSATDVYSVCEPPHEQSLDHAQKSSLSVFSCQKPTESVKSNFTKTSAFAVQSNFTSSSTRSFPDVPVSHVRQDISSDGSNQKPIEPSEISGGVVQSVSGASAASRSELEGLPIEQKSQLSSVSSQEQVTIHRTSTSALSASVVRSACGTSSSRESFDQNERGKQENDASEILIEEKTGSSKQGHLEKSSSVVISNAGLSCISEVRTSDETVGPENLILKTKKDLEASSHKSRLSVKSFDAVNSKSSSSREVLRAKQTLRSSPDVICSQTSLSKDSNIEDMNKLVDKSYSHCSVPPAQDKHADISASYYLDYGGKTTVDNENTTRLNSSDHTNAAAIRKQIKAHLENVYQSESFDQYSNTEKTASKSHLSTGRRSNEVASRLIASERDQSASDISRSKIDSKNNLSNSRELISKPVAQDSVSTKKSRQETGSDKNSKDLVSTKEAISTPVVHDFSKDFISTGASIPMTEEELSRDFVSTKVSKAVTEKEITVSTKESKTMTEVEEVSRDLVSTKESKTMTEVEEVSSSTKESKTMKDVEEVTNKKDSMKDSKPLTEMECSIDPASSEKSKSMKEERELSRDLLSTSDFKPMTESESSEDIVSTKESKAMTEVAEASRDLAHKKVSRIITETEIYNDCVSTKSSQALTEQKELSRDLVSTKESKNMTELEVSNCLLSAENSKLMTAEEEVSIDVVSTKESKTMTDGEILNDLVSTEKSKAMSTKECVSREIVSTKESKSMIEVSELSRHLHSTRELRFTTKSDFSKDSTEESKVITEADEVSRDFVSTNESMAMTKREEGLKDIASRKKSKPITNVKVSKEFISTEKSMTMTGEEELSDDLISTKVSKTTTEQEELSKDLVSTYKSITMTEVKFPNDLVSEQNSKSMTLEEVSRDNVSTQESQAMTEVETPSDLASVEKSKPIRDGDPSSDHVSTNDSKSMTEVDVSENLYCAEKWKPMREEGLSRDLVFTKKSEALTDVAISRDLFSVENSERLAEDKVSKNHVSTKNSQTMADVEVSEDLVSTEKSKLMGEKDISREIVSMKNSKPLRDVESTRHLVSAETSKPIKEEEFSRDLVSTKNSKDVTDVEILRDLVSAKKSKPMTSEEEVSRDLVSTKESKSMTNAELSNDLASAENSKPITSGELSKELVSTKDFKAVKEVPEVSRDRASTSISKTMATGEVSKDLVSTKESTFTTEEVDVSKDLVSSEKSKPNAEDEVSRKLVSTKESKTNTELGEVSKDLVSSRESKFMGDRPSVQELKFRDEIDEVSNYSNSQKQSKAPTEVEVEKFSKDFISTTESKPMTEREELSIDLKSKKQSKLFVDLEPVSKEIISSNNSDPVTDVDGFQRDFGSIKDSGHITDAAHISKDLVSSKESKSVTEFEQISRDFICTKESQTVVENNSKGPNSPIESKTFTCSEQISKDFVSSKISDTQTDLERNVSVKASNASTESEGLSKDRVSTKDSNPSNESSFTIVEFNKEKLNDTRAGSDSYQEILAPTDGMVKNGTQSIVSIDSLSEGSETITAGIKQTKSQHGSTESVAERTAGSPMERVSDYGDNDSNDKSTSRVGTLPSQTEQKSEKSKSAVRSSSTRRSISLIETVPSLSEDEQMSNDLKLANTSKTSTVNEKSKVSSGNFGTTINGDLSHDISGSKNGSFQGHSRSGSVVQTCTPIFGGAIKSESQSQKSESPKRSNDVNSETRGRTAERQTYWSKSSNLSFDPSAKAVKSYTSSVSQAPDYSKNAPIVADNSKTENNASETELTTPSISKNDAIGTARKEDYVSIISAVSNYYVKSKSSATNYGQETDDEGSITIRNEIETTMQSSDYEAVPRRGSHHDVREPDHKEKNYYMNLPQQTMAPRRYSLATSGGVSNTAVDSVRSGGSNDYTVFSKPFSASSHDRISQIADLSQADTSDYIPIGKTKSFPSDGEIRNRKLNQRKTSLISNEDLFNGEYPKTPRNSAASCLNRRNSQQSLGSNRDSSRPGTPTVTPTNEKSLHPSANNVNKMSRVSEKGELTTPRDNQESIGEVENEEESTLSVDDKSQQRFRHRLMESQNCLLPAVNKSIAFCEQNNVCF